MGFYRNLYNILGWEYYGKREQFDDHQKHLKYKLNNEIIFKFYCKEKTKIKKEQRQRDITEFNKWRMNNEFKSIIQSIH